MRRHQSQVRTLLRRLTCGDAGLADDLAQDTFLLAYKSLARYRGDARIGTWLYRIAYHRWIDMRRVRKTDAELDDAVLALRGADVMAAIEARAALEARDGGAQADRARCARADLRRGRDTRERLRLSSSVPWAR